MRFRWDQRRRGLVDSIKCEECEFASDIALPDAQSEPPWASNYISQDQCQKIKHSVHPGRVQTLASISTLVWIKRVRRRSPTIVQTLLLSWQRAPVARPTGIGQRLDGVPVLEPFSKCREVPFHPALVQPDGFQSFLYTSHLRATLLQAGEETLHLHNKHTSRCCPGTVHTLKSYLTVHLSPKTTAKTLKHCMNML